MRSIFYHSVVPRRDPADYYSMRSVDAAQFTQQVRWLARHRIVLSLAEVVELRQAGRALPRRAVHLSFDDGFHNNVVAAEILATYRVPWTLFALTNSVLDGYRPWYIRLADALAPARHAVGSATTRFDLSRYEDKNRLASLIKQRVLDAPFSSHLSVLDDELGRWKLELPAETRWKFLDIHQLRQLNAAGVEIGGHTATHPNLLRCTEDELRNEIVGSADRLAAALGRAVIAFSYPDGRLDARVRDIVAERFTLAMATHRPPLCDDIFAMRRWSVGSLAADLPRALHPMSGILLRARAMRTVIKHRVKSILRARNGISHPHAR
ncbi:MAG: polysaccharide deacetylase [Gemmatimonadetes bacterium]|nr:polysaccharide deacetylase [Gemmatimonadota bacterium]